MQRSDMHSATRFVFPILALATLCAVLSCGCVSTSHGRDFRRIVDVRASAVRTSDPPPPFSTADLDRDGIPDEVEDALARQYAPIVILDRDDRIRPASIPWLLERIGNDEVGADVRPGDPLLGRHRYDDETRRGSVDPDDWVTYVHVFPRADGGIGIQYWFFYPYSEGPLVFSHESDWEHMTVHLDVTGEPTGAYLSAHENNSPGKFVPWDKLRREGDHPVVLSARGTHATYARHRDLAWFERAGRCDDLDRCIHPVWRTWEGGGLENLGERAFPRLAFRRERFDPAQALADAIDALDALIHPGRWGGRGTLPGTSAPKGPFFQRGFCHGALDACRREPGEWMRLFQDEAVRLSE